MSPLPSPSLLSKPRLTSPPVEVSYLFTFIHPIRPILTRSSPRSPFPPHQPPIILLVLIFLFVLRLHLNLVLILDLLLNLILILLINQSHPGMLCALLVIFMIAGIVLMFLPKVRNGIADWKLNSKSVE